MDPNDPRLSNPNDPFYSDPSRAGRYQFQNGKWTPTHIGDFGDYFRDGFWNDPLSSWTKDWSNVGHALGYQPKEASPDAPGGKLDTSQADAERARMGTLLGQLQQQAATGGGQWEGALSDATARAQSGAQALGQSQPGVAYGSALRNIGNAQGAAAQRAVGQGNVLRAQSKAGAQDQLSTLLGQQGGTDASQAASGAAAQQGITDLNNTLAANASKKTTSDSESLGGISTMGAMSDGGAVPGRPMVGGDDPKNDTVSAMLSPGEIVIPRSHAGSPEAAADFVRALHQQRGGIQHLDQGGTAGDGTGLSDKQGTGNDAVGGITSIFLPHVGAAIRGTGVNQAAPSIQNGGLLNTANYDATRNAQLANADLIAQRATGPDAATGQRMVDASDGNLAAAMQAARGRTPAGDILQRTVAATQGAGGDAAAAAGNAQAAGQSSLARTLAQQRSADLAFATARQQAAFRQTQINAGLGLEQQAALRGVFSGAGQAAMAGSAAAGGKDKMTYDLSDTNTPDFDQGLNANEWSQYPGSSAADLHGQGGDLWTGGVVRKKKYADGGEVEDTRAADFVRALRRSA